jgi:hypothetical protein
MIRTPGWHMCRIFIAFTLALAPGPLLAQDQAPSEQSSSEPNARALEPGQFSWHPEAAPEGTVSIIVSVPLQIAYVYRANALIGVSTVSTGKPGHDTPTGTFNILEKQIKHRSTLYNDASMPFMQRLTWDGVALHAGNIPGYPASHGCVRLPAAFAELLFKATRLGVLVTITEEAPSSAQDALALLSPAVTAPARAPTDTETATLPTVMASSAP